MLAATVGAQASASVAINGPAFLIPTLHDTRGLSLGEAGTVAVRLVRLAAHRHHADVEAGAQHRVDLLAEPVVLSEGDVLDHRGDVPGPTARARRSGDFGIHHRSPPTSIW